MISVILWKVMIMRFFQFKKDFETSLVYLWVIKLNSYQIIKNRKKQLCLTIWYIKNKIIWLYKKFLKIVLEHSSESVFKPVCKGFRRWKKSQPWSHPKIWAQIINYYTLTDTGEDSKLVHRRIWPKCPTLFSSLF